MTYPRFTWGLYFPCSAERPCIDGMVAQVVGHQADGSMNVVARTNEGRELIQIGVLSEEDADNGVHFFRPKR